MKRNFLFLAVPVLGFLAVSTLSCGRKAENNENSTQTEEVKVDEHYHADNDIAMTLRSIVDAINVGEPLNSEDYDFKGILTDGSGRILYTDVNGTPGEWEVKVLSPTTAVIRNLHIGDLLPDDLEHYLTYSLGLTPQHITEDVEYDENETASLTVYDFGTGTLRLEVHGGISSGGLEGSLLSIYVSSKD